MYVYNKKMKKKVYVIAGLSLALALTSALAMFLKMNEEKVTPIIKEEEEVVITLPQQEATFILPFKVEASVVKEYFDGSNHEVSDYTNLEGVYRPNQGLDYAYKDQPFDVVCMMQGTVSEVKEDALFGNSVTIKSEHVSITYQSLGELTLKEGEEIAQGEVIGQASQNSYNPELGNHVHIVVSVNNTLMDPKLLIGKSLAEIK